MQTALHNTPGENRCGWFVKNGPADHAFLIIHIDPTRLRALSRINLSSW
jgi:hypothetical protein